ncbi:MAG: alanine--glyoxylate aminotransferase [Acidobacteria bacterium RIFCSPLOWO2_12_FULL_59_11]|nr:MAG: alanine--glyoxylate aminotransferase [Acidobacteria bacterium RIFCSPLOWO2_12_FULL_59_11]
MDASSSPRNIPKRLLMGPGPSEVDARVYRAMTQPLVGYLDPALLEIMDQIQARLRATFRTRNRITLPLSGTGGAGMEAALVNFIEPGDAVAVIVGGLFASRMCEIVERCGGKLSRIEHPPEKTADLDQVRRVLLGQKLQVLAVVHSETSTGVCQPLEPLRELAQETGALFVVDAVSSLAGLPLEVDAWGVDICYSGSQKCIGCPPGLAPITLGDRAAEVLLRRQKPVSSWYLDLNLIAKYWDTERSYHHTPPISMFYALDEALRLVLEEGLEATWERHRQCHLALVQGMETMGLTMFVEDPAARAWTVNTIRVPHGVDDARIRNHLLERFGIEIGSGIGAMRGRIWRVGLLGRTANPELVLLLLQALESALDENGFSCPRGAAVAAAEKVFQTVNP